jgi:CRP/FNR family transcriptional regulator, cyclic AMP receptor protein
MSTSAPCAPSTSFLERLTVEQYDELRGLGTRRRYPDGACVFLEGDDAHDAVILLAGEAKAIVTAPDGREVILDVLAAGGIVGEISAIDRRPRSATVTALGPVEVLSVSCDAFGAFLRRHPAVLHQLLVDVADRLRASDRRQLEFGTVDALGRLCARLVELADRYGQVQADGTVLVRSPLTQSELAAWTGMSRDAVVKSLRALRRLGWVDNQGVDFTLLQPARLRERAAR